MLPATLNLAFLLTALLFSSARAVGFLQVEKQGYTSNSKVESHNQFHQPDFGRGLLLDTCGDDFNIFSCLADGEVTVGCGTGLKQNDEHFCVDTDGDDVCCGDDCCSFTPGLIAGVVVGGVVVVSLIVLASCACCMCCPFHKNLCCAKPDSGGPTPATAVVVPPPTTTSSKYSEA